MTSLTEKSLFEMAGLIRERRVSPVEYTECVLARIKAVDPQLRAFTRVEPEIALKAAAVAAGYPPELFSGHSLRAGFLTEAGRQNANLFKMKEHSRHASLEMVAEYVRDHERFREHAGEGFL